MKKKIVVNCMKELEKEGKSSKESKWKKRRREVLKNTEIMERIGRKEKEERKKLEQSKYNDLYKIATRSPGFFAAGIYKLPLRWQNYVEV